MEPKDSHDAPGTLKQTAVSTSAADALAGRAETERDTGAIDRQFATSNTAPESLVPMTLPDVHAYAEQSVAAGDSLNLRISSQFPYQTSIVRLGWDIDTPSKDWVIYTFPAVSNPVVQPIRPGSYVHVGNSIPSTPLSQMTLECWVRPWKDDGWQGLISQHTFPTACGFGLFLTPGGIAFYFGNGGAYNGAWLKSASIALKGGWHHVVATFSGGVATLWIDGNPVIGPMAGFPATVTPGPAPLRLAAYGSNGATANTLDGDLAMPVIYSRELGQDEIQQRAATKPPTIPSTGVLGCWPFSEEAGVVAKDSGPSACHGTIFNNATWMVGGPGFDASVMVDPQTQGSHGLRFASDDLYDCAWTTSQSYVVPGDLSPGLYAARITFGQPARQYHVTFVVKRPIDKPAAPILMLCSTNTWIAYGVPFPQAPDDPDSFGTGGASASAAGAPAFNMYSDHANNNRPAYQLGVHMPWGAATPYGRYLDPLANYGHLVRGERSLHVWLEKNGYDYDVASDLDLHENPSLLGSYQVVVLNGHSEYWSAAAYDGLQQFLQKGGNLVVASGNTMFWRVSFDPTSTIMECRKWPSGTAGGSANAAPGELFHSQDGLRGGLLRQCDRPAWKLTGLESIGWNGLSPNATFVVTQANHPLFQAPEPISVQNGSLLGAPLSVGHEFDVRVTTIQGTPPVPPGYTPELLASRQVWDTVDPNHPAPAYWNYDAQTAYAAADAPLSDMIYYSRSDGGRVFNIGSIAAGRGVATDPNMGALMRNVLHQFGLAHRLDLFGLDANQMLRAKSWDGVAWLPSVVAWHNLGGPLVGPPVAVFWAPGRISVMGIDGAGHLAYKWWDGANWNPAGTVLSDLGGQLVGRPCAVGWGRNRLNIFARGASGEIFNKWWDGAAWGPSPIDWQSLGGTGTGSPTAIAWQGIRLSVAALSATGSVIYKFWDGESWNPSLQGWTDMGGSFQFGPTLFAWGGNHINIFAVDGSGQLFNKWWDGQQWGPSITTWQPLGGALASAPVVVGREGDQFSVFARWQDGTIRAKWWDGTAWGPSLTNWQSLGGNVVGTPAAASWRGHWVSVMAISANGHFQYKWWDGAHWNPSDIDWQDLGQGLSGTPAALGWVGPH